jgi:Response regulator receiver domain
VSLVTVPPSASRSPLHNLWRFPSRHRRLCWASVSWWSRTKPTSDVSYRIPCKGSATASSGAEALLVATTARLDLIPLDMHLPDSSGLTVLETLKSDATTASIPVIILSIADETICFQREVAE